MIRTEHEFEASPADLWPYLCGSRMSLPLHSPLFRFGLPQPRECRPATDEPGAVGATRECVSDRGTITQRITAWEPERRLVFHMLHTDIRFCPRVSAIEDEFRLERLTEDRTRITRETRFSVSGPLQALQRRLVGLGLSRIHEYVFENWDHSALTRRTDCRPDRTA